MKNQQIFLNLAIFAIAIIFKCAYYVKRYNTCYIRHEPDVKKTIGGQTTRNWGANSVVSPVD